MIQDTPAVPAVGEVIDGYRFRGGDPSQESSWEQVVPRGQRLLPSGPVAGDNRSEQAYWRTRRAQGDPAVLQAEQGVAAARRAEGLLRRQEQQGGLFGGTGGIYSVPVVGNIAGLFDPEIRELDAVQARQGRLERQPGEGAISDFDAQQFLAMTYGKDKPLETNRALIQAQRVANDAVLQRREFEEWYFSQFGTSAGAQEAWRTYAQENPIFDPSSQQRGVPRLSANRMTWREYFTGEPGLRTQAEMDAGATAAPNAGAINPETGLPSYPGITALTANAQEFPIPERQDEPVVDLQTASRDEIIAALRRGGTFRDGPDGEPYSLPPQEPQFGPAQEGDREVQPGVAVRPQAGFMATPMAGPVRGAMNAIRGDVGAFAQSFAERIPFVDEMSAGLAGAISGRGYEAMRGVQRRLAEEDRQERPLARNLGGITGALAPLALPGGGGAAFVARAPNLGYAMTRGAAVGAGYGGVYGAADADGGVLDRARGALGGLMTGAAVGAAAPPVARGVGAMASPFVQPVTDFAGDLTARLMGRPMTQTDRAVRTLTRGATLGDLESQVQQMRSFGANPTFADVGGSNVQSRVRVAATRQTPGREIAEDFAAGRRGEIQDYTANLAQRISPREATPDQMTEALEQYQRNASRPAFDAVRGDRIRLDDASVMALRGQQGRNAIREAARAFGSSVDEGERLVAAELNRLADDVIDQPSVEITVGAADLISRYLNRAGGADQNLQRIFSGAGRAVRENARQQSPGYDAALRGFAERARLGDAVEVGERFVGNRGYTGDFVSGVQGMSPPEREIVAAAGRAAMERAAGTPGGAARVLDNLAVARDQVRRTEALLGPDAAGQVQQGAQIGRRLMSTGQNVNPRAGSSSFMNFSDNAQETGGAALNFMRGRPITAAFDFIRSRGLSDADAEEIVRIALDPSRTDEVLQILRTRFPEAESRRIVEQLTPLLAGQAGSVQAPRQPRMVGPEM